MTVTKTGLTKARRDRQRNSLGTSISSVVATAVSAPPGYAHNRPVSQRPVVVLDKVPHKRLLSKLKAYKLHNTIIEWIKNFLTDRKQRVRVNGKFSCWAKVFNGIPQGSILGPLLFIIFINDSVDFCNINLKLYLFTDDAKLYCHIKDMLDIDYLQRGIDNFVKWTERWQVTLNIRNNNNNDRLTALDPGQPG